MQLKNRHGQMLLEVVVAMGILVLFVTAFISLILGAYDGGRKARERTEASYLAWEGLEMVRSIASENFSSLQAGEFGVWQEGDSFVLSGSLTSHDSYSRTITLSEITRNEAGEPSVFGEVDPDSWFVESAVSWGGRSITLPTILTNWRRPRWRFDLLAKGEEGRMHATEVLPGTGGIVFKPEGDLSYPQVFTQERLFDGVVVRDLEIEADEDRLYTLSQINDEGPEFIAYDISNISNYELSQVNGTELDTDGIKFVLGNEYAYILTAHADRDVQKIRLSDFSIVNTWDILGAATPIDMAVDEVRGKAYVLTNREEQGKSVSVLPPTVVQTGPLVPQAYAQGAPSCNGQTATIYVSGGVIVGGPNNGDTYTPGVTTLLGNNKTGGTDVIVGTSDGDIIDGQNGIDIICGEGGNDTITGGNQADIIFGGDGADTIDGEGQEDTICGGLGNDMLNGGNSVDSIAGGDGTDTIDGGNGNDVCREGESITSCEDTASAIATCGVTAGDATPPSISSLSPSNGSTDINAGTNLVITFDEAVSIQSGNITVKTWVGGTTFEVVDVTSGQVSGNGTTTITINLSADLDLTTQYYVEIDATAFDDLAGNSFAGISGRTTWNFTTSAAPASSSSSSSSDITGRIKLPLPSEKLYVLDISDQSIVIPDATAVEEIDIGSARRIEIAGGYAYILTDNPGSELSIVNLATHKITKCDLLGDQLPNDLAIVGTTLYISRNSGVFEEFIAYEIDPLHPNDCAYINDHRALAVEMGNDGRAFTVLPERELAFVLAGFGLSDFHVIDLTKETSLPLKPFASPDGLCTAADTVGSYVFTGCRGDGGVTVFEGNKDVSDYFLWGTYTSPPFNAGEYASQIRSIKWHVEGDGIVLLRTRSAPTLDALERALWRGPDGTTLSFYQDAAGQEFTVPNTAGSSFVQWKAYFRKTGTETPVLKNVILSFE